ncbi:MAG: gmk [Acidimicrobiaceae bacterium]|nr:gmk [Acidimicrobiaceae bacterium]
MLGEYYGTPLPEPPAGLDVVLEIDVQGAEQVIERSNGQVVFVLLLPPSLEEQEARLRGRGDSEVQIRRRVDLGAKELESGRHLADAEVVNDDVERAVGELAAIVEAARKREA